MPEKFVAVPEAGIKLLPEEFVAGLWEMLLNLSAAKHAQIHDLIRSQSHTVSQMATIAKYSERTN